MGHAVIDMEIGGPIKHESKNLCLLFYAYVFEKSKNCGKSKINARIVTNT